MSITSLFLNYAEVVVGVPSCYIMYTRDHLDKSIGVAAQNCYKAEKGAFTGMRTFVLLI